MDKEFTPVPIRWVGTIAGLFSSVFMHWTLCCLGKNLTDAVATRTNASLVPHSPLSMGEASVFCHNCIDCGFCDATEYEQANRT